MANYYDVDGGFMIKDCEIAVFQLDEYEELIHALDNYCDSTGEFMGVTNFLMMLVRSYNNAL